MFELAPDGALGQRLLEVEVQVAQRARRDEAVGVGVDRVAEVAPGLLERRLLVHRDDREAAALVQPAYSMTVPPSASITCAR